AINAQQIAPRKRQMQKREEILIPAYSDAVLRNAAKTFKNAVHQGLVNLLPGVDRTRRFLAGTDKLLVERLDFQSVNCGDSETFVDEIVRQRVARRPHPNHEHIFAVV